jgi:transcriptional regulator with XRE-family HTH domain
MKRSARARGEAATPRVLLRLRAAAGVNQTTLATRLGITQSEVSKFERGERALDERRLHAWLHALEVEWTSFVRAVETDHLSRQARTDNARIAESARHRP